MHGRWRKRWRSSCRANSPARTPRPQKWAKKQGGELPSRIDGIVLFDGKCGWARDWYWLAPQLADVAGYAWFQLFGYGDQDWYDVSDRNRARAVRRVVIQ